MKYTLCKSFIILLLCILFSVTAFAHGGKTDSNGGHYDHSDGEYHYHHGYPAHQHENGECPYDFDDKTDHSPKTNTNAKTKTTTKESKEKKIETKNGWGTVLIYIVLCAITLAGLYILIKN